MDFAYLLEIPRYWGYKAVGCLGSASTYSLLVLGGIQGKMGESRNELRVLLDIIIPNGHFIIQTCKMHI